MCSQPIVHLVGPVDHQGLKLLPQVSALLHLLSFPEELLVDGVQPDVGAHLSLPLPSPLAFSALVGDVAGDELGEAFVIVQFGFAEGHLAAADLGIHELHDKVLEELVEVDEVLPPALVVVHQARQLLEQAFEGLCLVL